jgi:hypothetical protein
MGGANDPTGQAGERWFGVRTRIERRPDLERTGDEMRLRGLASPLRYVVYVLMAFLASLSAGVVVAVIVAGQPETTQARSGSAETVEAGAITKEATALEATAAENEAEGTNLKEPVEVASFVHTATEENSRGDFTYVTKSRIDGDPKAVFLVKPVREQKGAGGAAYGHNIGVWYEYLDKDKWAIFNQDLAPVPAGTTFEVTIPRTPASFVHRAGSENTEGNATFLDHRLTNGEPDVAVSVTQNWNPGGGPGVYNNHPVGARYNGDRERWSVYNEDGARMPAGASFNVAVSGAGEGAR